MEPELSIPEEEEATCNRVVKHLTTLEVKPPPVRFIDNDTALVTLRDQIAEARLEDVPALLAQMEQVAAIQSRRGDKKAEAIDPAVPYFGHLRLDEKDRGVRDVLIGKTTHIEPRKGIRIVDWRHAPVSQLYYRYQEGASYEEQFGDREVEGKVVARRTLTIHDGKLRRVTSPQGVFVLREGTTDQDEHWTQLDNTESSLSGGEGSAVRAEHMRGVLGAMGDVDQREDRHLPEIAALLDPRQFELISRADSGLVVVQGGAGSGKTTIGVHRMAFLAFQSKQRFAPERMLVVVGTPALRDYIGHLLKALGMGEVRVVMFSRWARRARDRAFEWMRKLGYEDNTPLEVSRFKTDPVVLKLLETGAKALRQQGRKSPRDAVWLWAEMLTSGDDIRAAFAKAAEREGYVPRLTPQQLERALRHCADRCPAVVEWQLEDEDYRPIAGADGVIEKEDDRATLDIEDDALLLRAYQLLCGPLRYKKNPLRYEHLFVDEAQDLAPIDMCVLADIVSARKSITLAGDTSQRLNLDTGFTSWQEVLDALQLRHVEVEPLRIAYRSTKEVLTFARGVLGPLVDPEEPSAPRAGAPVEHHHFPSCGAAAAFLGEVMLSLHVQEPRATVAILARYPEQADAYFEGLQMAEVPNLRRVSNYDFSFKPGVDVTEIRQVKGLEYDYVILVDVNAASYPREDAARYQLHIGATRAAHQLWIVTTDTASPLLPSSMRDEQ